MKKIILSTIICLSAIFNLSAQFDDKFYFPSKEMKEITGKYKEYHFNIDSISLHAILLQPIQKPKATILFFHGAGGNITSYSFITDILVKEGYQVFMPDFRGYGKSTGKPTHINIAHDAQFVFNKIMENDSFKDLPILIYGASMGTQIAVKLTKDNQSKISGLILDGTISSFTDMAILSVPEEQKPMIAQLVTSPYAAKEDIKEINSIPKLFIHSKEDQSVPFYQGIEVYNNAQEPKEFWDFEGGHLEAAGKFPEILAKKIHSLIF